MRVFDVEIVAIGGDVFDRHLPGVFAGFTLLPPFLLQVEFLDTDGFGFVVA